MNDGSKHESTITDRILDDTLSTAGKIAARLAVSLDRSNALFPLEPAAIERLTADDEERLDALIHRFSSLMTTVQDRLVPALLRSEDRTFVA